MERLATQGGFAGAYIDAAAQQGFRPKYSDKFTGGDSLKYVECRRECACWHQISDFKPGY